MPNYLNYNTRDYEDIYRELDLKYPNQPAWFKDIIASLFDIMYLNLDYAVQDLFSESMVSIRNMFNLLKMFNYNFNWYSSASCKAKIKLNSSSTGFTLPKKDAQFVLKTDTGKTLFLSALDDLNFPSGENEIEVNLVEGVFYYNYELGFHTGTINEEFLLPYNNIDIQHFRLTVDNVQWDRIDDLVLSTPIGKHYEVNPRSDGNLVVIFGDGNLGAIPNTNSIIKADFLVTNGFEGNFTKKDSPANYTLSFQKTNDYPLILDSGHELLTNLDGGNDIEDIYRAKDLAIKTLRTVNGATTEDSIKYLCFKKSSAVHNVKILPSYGGMFSIGIVIIPKTGGVYFDNQLENFLKERTLLGFSNIKLVAPFYVPVNISIDVKMRPGYSFTYYLDCIKFVCALNVCENNGVYINFYRSRDWESISELAFNQFGFNIISDYRNYLIPVFDYFLRKGGRDFGDKFIINDLITSLQILTFVESVVVNVPAMDITNLNLNQITQLGTLNVSQIF